MEIRTVSLKNYSSLAVGGEGKLVTVTNVSELQEAVAYAQEAGLQVHIVGGGTNSYFGENLDSFLFIEPNFHGVSYSVDGNVTYVKAYASEVWDDLVSDIVSRQLRGVENLSYIPGSVGAAPIQNIGAYGAELRNTFLSCDVFDMHDMQEKTLYVHDCAFGYRDSLFKHEKGRYVIISVTLRVSESAPFMLDYKPLTELKEKENLTVSDVRDAVVAIRQQKLPEWKEYPNCGSFFKNPFVSARVVETVRETYPEVPSIEEGGVFKIPAAWLIEHVAEMKGVTHGSLRTWDKQPLVIVNSGGATADDVEAFANIIRKKVEDRTGIILEQEVNRVG